MSRETPRFERFPRVGHCSKTEVQMRGYMRLIISLIELTPLDRSISSLAIPAVF